MRFTLRQKTRNAQDNLPKRGLFAQWQQHKMRTVIIGILAVASIGVLVLRSPLFVHANACSSNGTGGGNWSSAATWTSCGATTPQSGDSVTIAAGDTVTLDQNATITSLSFASGATAAVLTDSGGNKLTITSTVTMGQPTAAATNAWNINTGSAAVTGLITFSGSTNDATEIAKIVTTTGSLDANGGITFTASNSASAVIDMSGGAGVLNLKGALTTPANSSTFTMGTTSSFNYADSSAQTINFPSSGKYNNLLINNSAGATQSANIALANVGGNTSVQTGVLKSGGFNLSVGGNLKVFSVSNGAAYEMSGSTTAPTTFGIGSSISYGASSTVRYLQTATPTAISATTYGNLELKPAGTATQNFATGTTTVAGNLTMGDGTNTTTVSANANSTTLTVSGDLSISASATFVAHASNTFSVGGSWSNVGTFTNSSGTVTFTSTAGGKTFSGTMTGGSAFNNITFNGSGGAWSFGANSATVNNFTITNGTVTAPSATLTVNGDFGNSGTFTHNSGTVTFAATSGTKNLTGTMTGGSSFYNVIVNGSGGTWSMGAAIATANNFDITNGTFDTNGVSNYAVTVGGNLTANAGTWGLNLHGSTVTVSGNWDTSVASGLSPGTSTVVMNGTGTKTLKTNSTTTGPFYNLQAGDTSGHTTQMTSGIGITNIFTLGTGTIDLNSNPMYFFKGGSCQANPLSLNPSGTFGTNSGEIIFSSALGSCNMNLPGFTYNTDVTDQMGSATITVTGTVTTWGRITAGCCNPSSAVTGSIFDFNGQSITTVAIAVGNGAPQFVAGASNITITGSRFGSSWDFSCSGCSSGDGVFTAGTSTVVFQNTGASGTFNPAAQSFYNLKFNGSGGTWSPTTALTVSNDLSLVAGTLQGTSNVTVNGNVDCAGAGTCGTITLTGGTFTQRVAANKNFGVTTGSNVWTFNNLTFSNSSASSPFTITTQTGGTGTVVVSGDLLVGKTGDNAGATTTLNAGNRTWTLNATDGNPFQILASPQGVLTGSTSTFSYAGNNGSGNTTIQPSAGYYNLTAFNTSETYVMAGATTVANTLTVREVVTGATFSTTASNYALTAGFINIGAASTFLSNASTITLTGTSGTLLTRNGGGTFTQGTSTWIVASASGSPTLLDTGTTFHILTINAPSATVINAGANITTDNVAGNEFYIQAGVFNLAGRTITPGTSGLLQVDSGATFCLGGTTSATTATCDSGATQTSASTFPAFTTVTLNAASTVIYLADAAQTVLQTPSYGNLSITPKMSASRAYTMGGAMTINGNFNVKPKASAGSLALTVTLAGTTTVASTATTTIQPDSTNSPTASVVTTSSNYNLLQGSLDIEANGTLDASSSTSTITIALNYTNNGTFTAGTSTVKMSSTSSGKTLAGTMTGGSAFYDLTFNGVSGAWTFSNNATVSDNFTITNGSVTAPSALSVGGKWHNAGTFTHNSGTVTFTNTGASKDIDGTLTGSTGKFYNAVFDGVGGTWLITGAATFETANDLTINNGNANTNTNSTWIVGRDVTLANTSGVAFSLNGWNASVGRNYVDPGHKTGAYSPSTVTLTGTGTVSGLFYNLSVAASGQTTTQNESVMTVNGTMTFNGGTMTSNLSPTRVELRTTGGETTRTPWNIATPTTFTTFGVSKMMVFDQTDAVTAFTENGGDFGAWDVIFGCQSPSATVMNHNLQGNLTAHDFYFNNGGVTAGKCVFNSNNHNMTANRYILGDLGGVVQSTGPITMNMGSATVTLNGTGDAFYITNNKGSGHTIDMGSSTWNVYGNIKWVQGTGAITVTAGTSTLNMLPAGGATRTFASNAQSVYNFGVNAGSSTGIAQLTGALTVSNNLTVTTGVLDDNTNQITGNGTGTFSMAASTTLKLGGTGTATTFPTSFTNGHTTLNASSLVVYNATVSQTISGTPTYGNLELSRASGTPTKTLAAATTLAGTLTIDASNTLDTSSGNNYALTVGGNFAQNGTFTAQNGTVTLNGTSQQTVNGTNTGGSAFYNLTISNSSGASATDGERTGFTASVIYAGSLTVTNNYVITTANVRVEHHTGSTYTFNNINWNGGATTTRIFFRSSATSGTYLFKVTGTQTAVSYVNVSRSDASVAGGSAITANGGTDYDAGNNTNWTFGTTITISGNIYAQGSESTANATSVSVSVEVNNVYLTTVTGQTSSYSVPNIYASAGAVVGVYIDGNALNANTFTVSSGSTMTNKHLYINRTAIFNDNAGSTTNANICAQSTYPGGSDALFTCSSTVPTYTGDSLLVVNSYTPGGNVNTPAIKVESGGTYVGGSETLAITGSGVASAFGYQRTLTIDHTKVPNIDQTNFPILVSLTDATLKVTGSGGHVQNSSGYDINFFSDAALTTKYSWEVEKYVSTTGEIEAWVKIPTLSHTVDTVIYVAYGNSSISSFQGGSVGSVWDSSYKGVWHLPDGSSLSLNDSTTNASTLTNTGATAATGKIDGGAGSDGSSQYLTSPVNPAGMTSVTFEGWVYLNGPSTGGQPVLLGSANRINLGYAQGGGVLGGVSFFTQAGNGNVSASYTGSVSFGAWHYLAGTYDGTTVKAYLDGAVGGTTGAQTGGIGGGAINVRLGTDNGAANTFGTPGVMDEARISDTARSADWIATEYNNQSAPGTFETLGAETTPATSTPFDVTSGTFTPNTNTVTFTGTGSFPIPATTFYNLQLYPASGTQTYAFSTGTLTVGGDLNVGNGSTLTVAANTNNPTVAVSGTMTINSTTTWVNGSGALSIGSSYSNSGTFTAGTGTVTFTATTSGKTLAGTMTGGSAFYNLTFNGVGGAWTYSAAVATLAGGAFNVTNGSVTASNNNLTVGTNAGGGDFTLANTAGVAYVAGSSTVQVGGSFSDVGPKGSFGSATLKMVGNGTIVSAQESFGNMYVAYTGYTTTDSSTYILAMPHLEGGTLTSTSTNVRFQASNTAPTFDAATTLTGGGYFALQTGNGGTLTLPAADFGNWGISIAYTSGSSSIVNQGGNLTTTGDISFSIASTGTLTYNTQNYNLTTGTFQMSDNSGPGLIVNFGSSTVNITGTGDALYVINNNTGTVTLNLQTSTTTVAGNVKFAFGTGTATVTSGTSTLTMAPASGTKTINSNAQSLYNFTVNGAGTAQLAAALTVSNNFTITAGTFDTKSASNYALTVGGNYSNSGTFTAQNGTVTFNSTATGKTLSGTLNGSSAFYHLTFNGVGGGWTMGSASTVSKNLTITNGTLDDGGNQITGSSTGDIIMASGGTLKLGTGTATTFPTNYGFIGNITLDPASTVIYKSTSNQTIDSLAAVYHYGNLQLSAASGTPTKSLNGVTNVDGNLTIDASNTLDTVSGQNYALSVKGNYSNSGTFTSRNGTVTFTSTTTGKTIATNGNSFYNLTFNGSGGDWTPSAAVTVTNDLTMTAGSLLGTNNVTVNGNVTGTAGVITLTSGTFEQRVASSKSFSTSSGSTVWTFNNLTLSNSSGSGVTITTGAGTGTQLISGNLLIGKSGDTGATTWDAGSRTWTLSSTAASANPFQLLASPAAVFTPNASTIKYTGLAASGNTTVQPTTYNNLIVNHVGGTFVLGGATTVGGTLTITNGTLDTTGSNYALNLNGSYTNNGAFTANSGTVTFGSTASGKTLAGTMTGASAFYNLAFNGVGGAWTFSSAVAATNDFTVTNGDVTAGSNALTVTRDYILANTSGVAYHAGTSTITVSRHFTDSGNKFDLGTTSSVVLNGTGTVTNTSNETFYNLSVGYSSFTTSFASSVIVNDLMTFNGGTVTGTGFELEVKCDYTSTPIVFASATTLNGSANIHYESWSCSQNITAGNYGNWNLFMQYDHGTGLAKTLAGDITTTGNIFLFSNNGDNTSTFSTANHNITASIFYYGDWGSDGITSSFGSSTVSLAAIGVGLNECSTCAINLGSSAVTVSGNVSFVNGTGAIAVTPGTSTLTMTPASSSTTMIDSGGQSLYNFTVNGSGGTVQLSSALVPTHNLTITAGTLDTKSGSNYALTVGGDFANSGTFTARSGTVTLNGSAQQTVSGTNTGGSAFYNLTITNNSGASATDNERTGFTPSVIFNGDLTSTNVFTDITANSRIQYHTGSTYTFSGINWNGQAKTSRIFFRNSATSGTWLLKVTGTQTAVSSVNVSRSDASVAGGNAILANDTTDFDAGNNTNWTFGVSITVSGNIYIQGSESTTNSTPVNVSISVNNGAPSTQTGVTSSYSMSSTYDGAGTIIMVYIDGNALDANTITIGNGSSIVSLNLYIARTAIYNSNSGNTTNANICSQSSYPASGDNLFTCSSGVPTFTGDQVLVAGGYAPGGNVNASKIEFMTGGTYTGGTEVLALSGSGTGTSRPLYINGGTFTSTSDTVAFTSTSASDIEATTYYNLQLYPTSGTQTYTLNTGTVTVNNNLDVGNGSTLTIAANTNNPTLVVTGNMTINSSSTWVNGSGALSIGGSYANSGTYTAGTGTITFTSGTSGKTLSGNMTGSSALYKVAFNGPSPFGYSRALTIDHTKVPNTDQTNFTTLISLTDATLKVTGSGGHVQNSSGYDINFFSDSALTTKLNWEVEKYTSSTGELIAWVKIPSLSHTTDTTIYMAYGNSSISTFQGGATGTAWDSYTDARFHLEDNAANTTVADSSANTTTGTANTNTNGLTTVGVTGNGFLGNASTYFQFPFPYTSGNSFTFATWIKVPNTASFAWFLGRYSDAAQLFTDNNGKLTFTSFSGGGQVVSAASLTNNTWAYVVGKYNAGSNLVYLNLNGVESSSGSGTAPSSWAGNMSALWNNFRPTQAVSMDEIRIDNTFRSADWSVTEYNNQSAPSTFFATGSEQNPSGAWTIQDPMTVTADATDTLNLIAGTVTLGNGSGDNLEVRGTLKVAATANQTATFQTAAIAVPGTITIDINQNGSGTPPACTNCAVTVGATSGTGQGSFKLAKNAILRLNPNSASQVDLPVTVNSTGYFEALGSQDYTGTSTSGTGEGTVVDSGRTWTSNENTGKFVRMTNGLAVGEMYPITTNSATQLNYASTESIQAGITSVTDTGNERLICANTQNLITASHLYAGQYVHDKTTGGYYQIIDSGNNQALCSGSGDAFNVMGVPDSLLSLAVGHNFTISDGVRSGDSYEILDPAYVTAEAGTACNATVNETGKGEAYITGASGSQTLIQYAKVCNLGRNTAGKEGISTDVNGANTNEGITITKSWVKGGYQNFQGNNGSNYTLSNNLFTDSTQINIFISGSGNTISNNLIMRTLLGIVAFGTGNTATGNEVYNSTSGGIGWNVNGGTLSGNTVCAIGNNNSISGSANTVSNNLFANTGATYSALELTGSGTFNNIVTSNTIIVPSGNGITVDTSARSNYIGGNSISNSTNPGAPAVLSASGNIFDNNLVSYSKFGVVLSGGSTNVISNNTFTNNSVAGVWFVNSSNNNNVFYKNTITNNNEGIFTQTVATGTISIQDTISGSTTADIDLNSLASTAKLYGTTLNSSTKVQNAGNSSAALISREQNAIPGITSVWGNYSTPADIAETPQTESTDTYNYANNLWEKSATAHFYAGTGTEDSDLNYDLSSASLSSGPYTYRLVSATNNQVCASTTFTVYRNNTNVGTATCGTQFTDSNASVNVKFTVDGGVATKYATGDAYVFTVWDASNDTSVQKRVQLMTTASGYTVPSGTTLQLKGQSATANQSEITRGFPAGGWHMDVAGTIDAQYYLVNYLGGTNGTAGLNLQAGATVTNLANGTFDNFQDTGGASDRYISVDGSLIGTGTPSKTFDGITFTQNAAVPTYSIRQAGGSPSTGNYWLFSSAVCNGWSTCEGSDSDTGDGAGSPNQDGFIRFVPTVITNPTVNTQINGGSVRVGGGTVQIP